MNAKEEKAKQFTVVVHDHRTVTVSFAGEDISAFVKGLTLTMGVGDVPRLVLDMVGVPVNIEVAEDCTSFASAAREWRKLNVKQAVE